MIKFSEFINEQCDCWKGYKRVPGTKSCAPGSCVKESLELDESLDPSEIASNPKMYDASIAKKAYYHKSASASDKESLARHLDRHHGNKEWRKPVKEDTITEGERGLWDNIHAKRKRIKAGSGERMRRPGEEGRPTAADFKAAQNEGYASDAQRKAVWASRNEKKVKKEEVSADEQFDLIEEMVMDIAEQHNLNPELVWEKFEDVDDNELLEAAVDAKGHKSSTGGLTQKGRDYYNRKTGGNLQAPVTTPPSKLDPDSKAAKRRKSFCARMGGMPGPMKDDKGRPTRKALALRKWNC